MKGLPSWKSFWKDGVGLGHIYTGAISTRNDKYDSDEMWRFGSEYGDVWKNKINQLYNQDWSWVKRYVDVEKIRGTIRNTGYIE